MGGRDDVLANVFLNKGATAVIANTDITSANYAFNMMESIIGLLVKKNQSSLIIIDYLFFLPFCFS